MTGKNYCILRMEKKKSLLALGRAFNHNYRTTDSAAPHSRKELRYRNEELVGAAFGIPDRSFTDVFHRRILESEYYKTHKLRKNAIPALEFILSFSKEQRDKVDLDKWKQENIKWLQSTYGKDNVISVVLHDDEKDPDDPNGTGLHLHAIILPFDERGCLNSHEIIGGPSGLSKLQTEYARAMSQFGLVRGEMEKGNRHITPALYHRRINEQLEREMSHIPAPREGESAVEYARRLEEPHWEIARDHTNDILEFELERYRRQQSDIRKKQQELRKTDQKALDEKIKAVEDSRQKRQYEKDLLELRELLGWGDTSPTKQQMHEAKKKLRLANNLAEAFQNYSDHDFAVRVNADMEKILRENNHRKRALLEKTENNQPTEKTGVEEE